jgi:hypothetical protein
MFVPKVFLSLSSEEKDDYESLLAFSMTCRAVHSSIMTLTHCFHKVSNMDDVMALLSTMNTGYIRCVVDCCSHI